MLISGTKLGSFHPRSKFQYLHTASESFGDMRNWPLTSVTPPNTCGEHGAFLSTMPHP